MKSLLGKIWRPVYAQIDLKNCTFKLQDGDTPPNYIEVKIGQGNLTYSEKVDRQYVPDRGLLDQVRNGDEQPMDVNFDFTWEYLTGSSTSGSLPTVEDALKNKGNAADWVSTDSDSCAPFALDIIVENLPPCTAEGDMETITLPDFRYETVAHDFRAGTVAVTGKCNAKEANIVRESASGH